MNAQSPSSGSHQPCEGPSVLDIDLEAVAGNVATLREHARNSTVMAVVKADAYGHGLVPCARAALAGGAAWLGTAQLSEALALRAAGITAPILSWLLVPSDPFAQALQADLELGAATPEVLQAIIEAARLTGVTARVQLKVDTGLGRNGMSAAQWGPALDQAAKAVAEEAIQVTGVFSHLAWADAPMHPTIDRQIAEFTQALATARASLDIPMAHLANSAATLTRPDTHFDLVRPGLAVYGLSPVPDLGGPQDYGLGPAMSLRATVAAVKPVPGGHGVSYAHAYTTTGDTELALIPVGYADGIPRHASSAGPVWVSGRRYSVAGRVCMDQIVLDVGPESGIAPGDQVVIFSDGAQGQPTAQDWAQAAQTISYEIVTRVGPRVPRRYVGEPA